MPEPMIYLDHAATSPVCAEALEAMLPFLKEEFGNPNSVHPAGMVARAAVETARHRVAALVGADDAEIVFTSGATESNNLAVRGILSPFFAKEGAGGVHAVTTNIEHPSVAETFADLRRQGLPLTVVPAGENGVVAATDVLVAVRPETALVSVMAVNNEVGTIQPVAEIGSALKKMKGARPLFHVDAVQAVISGAVDVDAFRADLLSLSAHKIGGPKGVGALFVRRGTALVPILTGGGQESGLRSGTENVAGIVGFGAAAERLKRSFENDRGRFIELRDALGSALAASGLAVKPLLPSSPTAPHIVALECPGADADFLVLLLGKAGFAVSAGSACHAGSRETSLVLKAIGLPDRRARTVIRVSFGFETKKNDIARFVVALGQALKRSLSAAG